MTAASRSGAARSRSGAPATHGHWAWRWCTSTSRWCRASPVSRTSRSSTVGRGRGRATAAPGYRDRVEARARELKLEVELDAPVEGLGVGARQRIEILKALMSDTGVLLLDEPTAVLAPREVEGLFAVLGEVAGAGTAIVLVAHKLDEVLAAADRVTVLRRGRWVLTTQAASVSVEELAGAMVGGAVTGVRGAGGRSRATADRGRGPDRRGRTPSRHICRGPVGRCRRPGTRRVAPGRHHRSRRGAGAARRDLECAPGRGIRGRGRRWQRTA